MDTVPGDQRKPHLTKDMVSEADLKELGVEYFKVGHCIFQIKYYVYINMIKIYVLLYLPCTSCRSLYTVHSPAWTGMRENERGGGFYVVDRYTSVYKL